MAQLYTDGDSQAYSRINFFQAFRYCFVNVDLSLIIVVMVDILGRHLFFYSDAGKDLMKRGLQWKSTA